MFDIQEELKKLPGKPGVYIMHDEEDDIIYVGKAISLKNRVRQYFQSSRNKGAKIEQMVTHIRRFEYIVTDSELEALVLECNLIKEHRPKYNTMLMDDKAYPFIKVTVEEPFPRVMLARKMVKDKSKYFGPYTSAGAVKDTIELIRKLYQIRSCNRKLPRDIGKERPCLNYHIHQCKAPCQGYISQEEYRESVNEVIHFLNGNYDVILKELEEKISYHFQDKHLLAQALTHSSYANEHRLDHNHCNERLEFLGDAVLEIVTSDFLYHKYTEKPEESFNVNFDDFIPSASFGFKITEMSNVRAGYNMRIWRPSIWYLNPYLNDANPSYISQGNPSLESEKSHSFNISYSNFTQKFNINMALNYSFNNNGIERITTLMNDNDIPGLKEHTGKEVLYSTYQNSGKNSNLGLSGYVNWNASPKTRVYMNLWGNYSRMESPSQGLKNSGWNLFAYGGVQQTLPLEIRLSVNVMGSTPYVSLQGKGSSYYDYSISVNRSFLKEKRLTVSAFAGNFFKKYMTNKNMVNGDNFWQESSYRYSRQRFGMSISYRIGELKASVKKAARTIENDDVKGGDGGGSGQGGVN